MATRKITPFSAIYEKFLSRITDDMYMQLTREETESMLQQLLMNAIHWFEFPRFNLYDYDERKCRYNIPLTAEQINILAVYMVVCWIDQQLASIENVRMKYSGSDFKFTSQANHMAKLQSLRAEYERIGFHLQRLYKRRFRDEYGVPRSTMDIIMAPLPKRSICDKINSSVEPNRCCPPSYQEEQEQQEISGGCGCCCSGGGSSSQPKPPTPTPPPPPRPPRPDPKPPIPQPPITDGNGCDCGPTWGEIGGEDPQSGNCCEQNNEKINIIEYQLSEIMEKLHGMSNNAQLDKVAQEIANLKNAFAQSDKKTTGAISTIVDDIKQVKDDINTVAKATDKLGADNKKTQNKLNQLQKAVQEIKNSDIGNAADAVNDLKDAVNGIQDATAALVEKTDAIDNKTNEMADRVDGLADDMKSAIDGLNDNVQDINDTIDALNDKIDNVVTDEISALNDAVNRIDDTLKELQEREIAEVDLEPLWQAVKKLQEFQADVEKRRAIKAIKQAMHLPDADKSQLIKELLGSIQQAPQDDDDL